MSEECQAFLLDFHLLDKPQGVHLGPVLLHLVPLGEFPAALDQGGVGVDAQLGGIPPVPLLPPPLALHPVGVQDAFLGQPLDRTMPDPLRPAISQSSDADMQSCAQRIELKRGLGPLDRAVEPLEVKNVAGFRQMMIKHHCLDRTMPDPLRPAICQSSDADTWSCAQRMQLKRGWAPLHSAGSYCSPCTGDGMLSASSGEG